MLEYELDIAQKHLAVGDDVVFAYCGGKDVNFCPGNQAKGERRSKIICAYCKSRVHQGMDWLSVSEPSLLKRSELSISIYQQKKISEFLFQLRKIQLDKRNLKELLCGSFSEINEYASSHLVDAACSQLLTDTGESRASMADESTYFIDIVETGLRSFYETLNLLNGNEFDRAYIFNGRIPKFRMPLVACREKAIEFFCYEYPEYGLERYLMVRGSYPHDMAVRSIMCQEMLDARKPSLEEIKITGEMWFRDRRALKFSGYEQFKLDLKFERLRKGGCASLSVPADRDIISFFVVSEDELGSIRENAMQSPFSQIEAIEILARTFPDATLVVRTHPNLQGRDRGLQDELSSIAGKYKSIRLVKADEVVCSYQIVEQSNLVVTFGSTIGLEAASIGKKVLVIGVAWYQFSGCVAVLDRDSNFSLGDFVSSAFGSGDLFPGLEARKIGALAAAWCFVEQGESPDYLIRSSYFGGQMVRNANSTKITGHYVLKIFSEGIYFTRRLLSFIQRRCRAII